MYVFMFCLIIFCFPKKGDTHGQYFDVLNIFNFNGMPSPTNCYLFNGDFVDRGPFGVEVYYFIKLIYLFLIIFLLFFHYL